MEDTEYMNRDQGMGASIWCLSGCYQIRAYSNMGTIWERYGMETFLHLLITRLD